MTSRLHCAALVSGFGALGLHAPLDWQVNPGQAWCVLGKNGVGKSTLFRTLLGLQAPLSGSIRWDDIPLIVLDHSARASAVAYVPQRAEIPIGMTVSAVLRYGAYRNPGLPFDAAALLNRVGLAGYAQRTVHQLSGGEQQRVMIARALAQNARTIIFDEPTAHLDMGSQAEIVALLRSICAAGIAVIFSSHQPNEAIAASDHVLAMLPDGQWRTLATAVLDTPLLSALYACPIQVRGTGTTRTFYAVDM